MSLAVVAEPDIRERLRCVRIIAQQTQVSALGAATWDELEEAFEEAASIDLIFFTQTLPGSPEDAVERLLARTRRLILAVRDDDEAPAAPGVTRTERPIAEETLVSMARASGPPSMPSPANFMPTDVLQMICMSGDSQILVLSREGSDAGFIEVRKGEVWTACDGLGTGEEAFARMIRPEMRARIGNNRCATKERTVFKGLHELVLDSLRRIDEGRVAMAPTRSPAQLEAMFNAPDVVSNRTHALHEEARRLLMERNYDEAARVLIQLAEVDPESLLVRANLQQLRRLGYPKS